MDSRFSVESDLERRVLKVVDWIGGQGAKPDINVWVGSTGFETSIGSAVDIRGSAGAQGAQGEQGLQGVQGDQGVQGNQGPAGAAGPNQVSTATSTDISGILKGASGSVAQAIAGTDYIATNDSRLSDSRTPTSHAHGNITNAGAIGSTSGLPIKTGASGVLEAGAFGTSAGQFAEGNHTHSAFTGDSGSGGAAGFVPAPAAGDAVAGKYLDADGTWTVPPTGGGVSDGDKGDITVSASGATWTIDNDAVTYAKIQNISATSRVIGRKSSGSGDAEECTLSEILDFVGSAAQGDILYRGASTWTRLGAGTSGQFLRTNGAAANPSWNSVPVETGVITSNYTDSTGTLGNVTGMSFSLAANERVTAIFSGLWGTQTTNSGFRYDITGPASPTYVLYNVAHGITQTAFRSGDGATAFSTAFVEVSGNTALYLPVTIHLHVVNGASAGTVQLRMGGETNGVTFTLYQGFTLQLFRF